MSRLFLGNIPHAASQDDICQWIESHGFSVTSVDVILDRLTGGRRGFCFASLAEDTNLDEAISRLHGRSMAGRVITVSHAVPLDESNSYRRAG